MTLALVTFMLALLTSLRALYTLFCSKATTFEHHCVILNRPPNHFLTSYQPQPHVHSLKTVGKLAAKQLHFGNPFPLHFCYPVLIVVSPYLGVSVFSLSALTLAFLATWRFISPLYL